MWHTRTCILILFVNRALEVWGSWQVLEHELNRRRQLAEEEDRRRKGLGALIAQLKKYNKAQTRKEIDVQVCHPCVCVCVCVVIPLLILFALYQMFGDRAERVSFLRGSAKVVLYAIAR